MIYWLFSNIGFLFSKTASFQSERNIVFVSWVFFPLNFKYILWCYSLWKVWFMEEMRGVYVCLCACIAVGTCARVHMSVCIIVKSYQEEKGSREIIMTAGTRWRNIFIPCRWCNLECESHIYPLLYWNSTCLFIPHGVEVRFFA